MHRFASTASRRPSAFLPALLAPLLAGILTGTAIATPAADQSNSSLPTGNFVAIRSGTTAAQTFTVGFPGTLTGVQVVVDPRGTPVQNLELEIQATTGGAANGTVLASASVAPFGGVNPTVFFDVSSASLAVTAGQVLAAVIKSSATLGNDYLFRAVPGNRYGSGQFTDSGGSFASGAGWDAIFKTFVEPATLPGGPGTSDQVNLPSPSNNFSAIFLGSTAAQTFSVSRAGTLTRIDVMMDPRGTPVLDLHLEVQQTTAGVANGTVLARSIVTPFGGTNPMVTFDLSHYDLDVNAGDELAFVMRSNAAGGTDYLMRARNGDLYADGEFTNSSGAFATGAGWDAIFETFIYSGTTGVEPARSPLAGDGVRLERSVPNPISRTGTLRFALPAAGRASLSIFDAAGRRVTTLFDEFLPAGSHEARWNRTSDAGARVPAGVYFSRLTLGAESSSQRMVVIE
jgi:hypothetical protein